MGNEATAKEKNYLTVLEVALEAYYRGLKYCLLIYTIQIQINL